MKLFFLPLLLLLSSHLPAQIIRHEYADNYFLTMPELICHQTTEDGSDEVYMLVFYQYSDNTGDDFKLPTIPCQWIHWNMHPGDVIVPGTLLNFKLRIHQSIEILCILMEEDDWSMAAPLARGINELLRIPWVRLKDIYSNDIDNVLHLFDSFVPSTYNQNDWLGSFAMHVESNGVVSNFRLLQHPDASNNFALPVTGPMKCYFDGDGAFYEGTLIVSY